MQNLKDGFIVFRMLVTEWSQMGKLLLQSTAFSAAICLLYCHVSWVSVTNKTSFAFDDGIYWTFIQLVTTVHKSLSDTVPSSSDWTFHWNYSYFQLN
jgi:hypothetical protein